MSAVTSSQVARTAEVTRKALLAESDVLLDEVETLRLRDELEAPLRLREAIRALQIRLGRRNLPVPDSTIDAVHELVFAVQQRIMAANPNQPRLSRHIGRPGGQPVTTLVHDERKWKVLTLPAPMSAPDEEQWIELVESTVERAWDRWCYAQQMAVRAARQHFKPMLAIAVAKAAWTNYWNLLEDSQPIIERVRSPLVRGRLAAKTSAARQP